jgi:hypothetical protein
MSRWNITDTWFGEYCYDLNIGYPQNQLNVPLKLILQDDPRFRPVGAVRHRALIFNIELF